MLSLMGDLRLRRETIIDYLDLFRSVFATKTFSRMFACSLHVLPSRARKTLVATLS